MWCNCSPCCSSLLPIPAPPSSLSSPCSFPSAHCCCYCCFCCCCCCSWRGCCCFFRPVAPAMFNRELLYKTVRNYRNLCKDDAKEYSELYPRHHERRNYKLQRHKNPKCRLYWCSTEFIDWRYSQSCWYFRPLLGTVAPLPSLWPPPTPPPFPN